MPELRVDPIRGTRVVISGDRGARPVRLVIAEDVAVDVEACPFCPGHEAHTCATLAEEQDGGGWIARAFPNRFPALRVEAGADAGRHGPWGVADALGAHEVVVEGRRHAPDGLRDPGVLLASLRVVQRRLQDLAGDRRLRHLAWFRNHGALAGASQPHPHAQIVASAHPSGAVLDVAARAAAWRAQHGRRVWDDVVAFERADGRRWWSDEAGIVAFVAYAPRFLGEVWIGPAEATPDFATVGPDGLVAIARATERVLAAWSQTFGPCAHNVVLHAPPREDAAGSWHLVLTPRRVALGGYELMTGGTVLGVPPEALAAAWCAPGLGSNDG
ncbi:MAG: hypothetical protein RLZZ383_2213 [Pseudomonadota bacterium]|jgi:UDPglucose--hexose-1-phosphate uridylyltransferase